MSDRAGIKGKDNVGKKFSSLNLNQTYKGTKVETKAATGVSRHGLQSLGKVAASRRMPPPANLPSLKSENLGNDPTVALVPSGGGGWGSGKEKEASSSTATTTVPAQSSAQGTATSNQLQPQQPSKPTESSQRPASTTGQQTSTVPATTNQTSGTSTRTWANSSSGAGGQEKTSYPHQSQYFNREFPTLGGGNSGDKQPEERGSHQPYGQPPRNMHDPPWLDGGGSGPPPRPSYGMYNGGTSQGPPQRGGYDSQGYPRDGHSTNNYSRPEGSGTFPYMGQTRPSNYPGHSAAQRGHAGPKYGVSSQRPIIKMEDSSSGYARPSILKEDDIRAMDSEDLDDGGWAGAQEEIDYSVKLNFDDDEPPSPVDGKDGKRGSVPEKNDSSKQEVNHGAENKEQEANKRPPPPRQAWSGPTSHKDNQANYQQPWQDAGKQGSYHAQRPWPSGGHYPQQRLPFPSGPSTGVHPPGSLHQQDGRRMDQRGPESLDRNRTREKRIAIEQARQRKEQEELELMKQREAAAREKLKKLDAKTSQLHIQTHDNSVRDQTGPRSPLSPAGSDTQVRRIMRRKDSGSTGDDDASVKSVENFGKEEKKDSRKTENQTSDQTKEQPQDRSNDQAKETRERLRKTSSSDVFHDDGKTSRSKVVKEERKASESPRQPKEKTEEKVSVDKAAVIRKTSAEKEPQFRNTKSVRQTTDVEAQRRKPGDEVVDSKGKFDNKEPDGKQLDKRDNRKRIEGPDRRREGSDGRSNENLRRREETNHKKEQVDSNKESQDRNKVFEKKVFDNRKENLEVEKKQPESKNERGSNESLKTRDSLDRRKDDRKRGDDAIKRKRDDFERSDSFNDRGNRDKSHRERLHSGRGRSHLGGKSSLRGHPKSYSHPRTDRTGSQRRTSQRMRNDSKEYEDEDLKKTVPAEEKRQVSDKGEERRQVGNDRRSKDQYQESRSFGGDKRNDRQSKDDRPYRGSGRLPSRTSTDQRSGDKAGRNRGPPKNSGGFGIPPPKPSDQSKEDSTKGKSEEKSEPKDQQRVGDEAKPTVPTVDHKSESKESRNTDATRNTDSSNRYKTDQRQEAERLKFVPPVSNAWAAIDHKGASTKEAKTSVETKRGSDQVNVESTKEIHKSTPSSATSDIRRDRKPVAKADSNKQTNLKHDTGAQCDRVESRDDGKSSSAKESKVSEKDTKNDQRRERAEPRGGVRREQESQSNRGFAKGESRDSRNEERGERLESRGESRGESRRKQDSKFDERRDRTAAARDDSRRQQDPRSGERRSRVESRGERREQESKPEERRDRTGQRDGARRDPDAKPEERRDRRGSRDNLRREPESRPAERREAREDTQSQQQSRGRTTAQDESRHEQETKAGEENDRTAQRSDSRNEQGSTANKFEERFTMGSNGSDKFGSDRGRYKDSRRGGSTSRRGGRGLRGSRGRGRGRGRSYGSGRIPGRKSSIVSKEDDEDSEESGKYHSAHSSVDDSDESDDDIDEVPKSKRDDGYKDGRGGPPSRPSGGGTRSSFGTSRGRGRGRSPIQSRSPRQKQERPPRFQRQDQARGPSRGRGKAGGGAQYMGFSSKENWDDTNDYGKNHEKKNSDDGPSPKKRPPGDFQHTSGERSSGIRSKKPTLASQGNKKGSFLAKRQQEVVEGSRKAGSRSSAGPKSTFPAASTHGRHERRGKNESAPDLDDIPEPPKKNPRRTEPAKMGIEHIDLSNIAGFIDIDDIVQPTNAPEPASPQSGFVEVKSKRTQKEQRERAREEEERKRREVEKMMADAMMKPKPHKSSNPGKSHQTTKPPRFARNNMTSNHVPSVPRVTTPPGTVATATSPESSTVCGVPPLAGEQKRASPLMMEKPSSPPSPPMFNAWTKPLSITPAKPQNIPPEMSATTRPDPLAVGSGKPTRPSGTQPKSEEPELQIQVTLPDTFQAMPTERNMEPQTENSSILIEDANIKKHGVDSNITRKTDTKNPPRPEDSSLNNEKTSSVNEKRQNNSKFTRPPRFDKTPTVKRNVDGRKYKNDVKDQSNETKPQSSTGHAEKVPKEKADSRSSSVSRPRDLSKNQKPKSQGKASKSPDVDDNNRHSSNKDAKGNIKNNESHENLTKRDSAELDVRSMSESLLDESPLGVGLVETPESGSGTPSMQKMKTEDEITMAFEMEEKMVAAKKAWDDVPSSTAMVTKSSNWKNSSVSDGDNTEANETSVMDQIPRHSNERVEENTEPLSASPTGRMKKPTNGEQQNVCKVKPQQQQQPVKSQPVSSDVAEEFTTSKAISRSRMELQTPPNYAIPQAVVFPSKVTQYSFPFDQQPLMPFSQYVQPTNIASVRHTSPVRPQALQQSRQSPPQHAATFAQAQSMTTPSPLPQPTVIQDTYRPLMQGPLYSASYTSNPYFPISVVRQAAPPQSFQAQVNDDVSSSVYTLQPSKNQTAGHAYDPTVATGHPVFVPVEQSYVDHTQSQRQPTLGFYADTPANQASLSGNITHVQPTMSFPQTDKRPQQHSRESPSSHHEQQAYSPSGQSEMVKHVNAKPFQPPANTPTANVVHQVVSPNRPMTAVPGSSSVSAAYQMNSTVVSMPAGVVQGSSSSTVHSATSSVVTQTHSIPVSRLSFHPYTGAMTSYQRHHVQVPVQPLTQPAPYPAGVTYRASVASYPSSNVANQPGMLVPKSFPPVVRPLVATGRGAPMHHRMPEPIQRPTKPGIIVSNPKEKVASQPVRPKSAHRPFGRRSYNPIRGAPPQMISPQVQQPPRQQQQQQQQQIFRNQQHQLMLSGVQQFFAEDKQIELQQNRKHNQENQKRELPTASSSEGSQQTKQEKSG